MCIFIIYFCLCKSEPGYVFDKSSLLKYDHMRFGGSPVTTSTVEEADKLLSELEAESVIGKFCIIAFYFVLELLKGR